MRVQSEISARKLQNRIDETETIIIDSVTAEGAVGRSRGDAPEIDGEVHLPDITGLNCGDLVDVKIVAADEHDLEGELI